MDNVSKKKKDETLEPGAAQDQANVEEAAPEVSGDELADLGRALDECREEARRNHDLYLRTAADLDNFRKRAQREREDLAKFANERILREVLPVIDNLERALDHARQEGSDVRTLREGVEMTLGQFAKVLEKFNVTPLTSLGEVFDPARHEAMGQIESAEQPPNTVAQELQKGYLLHERLLRPALVMVTRVPVAPPAPGQGND